MEKIIKFHPIVEFFLNPSYTFIETSYDLGDTPMTIGQYGEVINILKKESKTATGERLKFLDSFLESKHCFFNSGETDY